MKYELKHGTYMEFHEGHDDSSIFCHLWAVRPQMQQKRVRATEIYKLFTGWDVMALPAQGDHRVFGKKYQLPTTVVLSTEKIDFSLGFFFLYLI